MIAIEFPPYQPKIKKEDNIEFIFDEVRKRWVVLTPEEWVRQNFLQYMIQVKQYPASLLAVEREITLGELKKRFDIVLFNPEGKALLLVECKEMTVQLDEKVLQQALRYNISLQVPFMAITNGSYTLAFCSKDGVLSELSELPSWQQLDEYR
jgi:type I site-specific restriction endonuclease